MSYLNADGLWVRTGTEEGASGKGGEFHNYGSLRQWEWKLTLVDYPFGSTIYIIDYQCILPKARYIGVDIEVHTACTGTSATLDFGLQRTDQTTEIDYDGFLAAVTMATIDAPAGKIRSYLAEATDSIPIPAVGGALLGTTTTNTGYPTVRVNTASFTAGVIFLRLTARAV